MIIVLQQTMHLKTIVSKFFSRGEKSSLLLLLLLVKIQLAFCVRDNLYSDKISRDFIFLFSTNNNPQSL